MFLHGDQLADGSVRRTTVCVIGSGPAGMTVARELGRAGIDVIVLETGGPDVVPEAQELSRVTFSAMPLIDVMGSRRRQIGGNSNRWVVTMPDGRTGVRYAPLDAVDLRRRDAVAHSGWPIGDRDLAPHYDAACAITGIGPTGFDPDRWSPGTEGPWKLDPDVIESKVFRFGPRTAFHLDLADELSVSSTVTVLHHTTALELCSDSADGPVRHVRCRTLGGRSLTVEADRFVVATSGLGNPHLLLASRSARPAGLGNEHDLVGRFLQDHPLIEGGSLDVADPAIFTRSGFYDMRTVDGHSCLGYLALSATAVEERGLAGLSTIMFPRLSPRRSKAMQALLDLSDTVSLHTYGKRTIRDVARVVAGIDAPVIAGSRKLRYRQSLHHGLLRGGWSTMPHLDSKFCRWELIHQVEQRPDPENRVTLNRETDALGMPTLDVRWRWSADDAQRAAEGRRVMAEELERAEIGTVTLPDDGDLPGLGDTAGTAHYMGTTRMHDDPRQGVVDRNCRVHSVPNLYVAGCSVFPTSGYANPTFTLVALAHRLAQHLAA